MLFDTNKGEDKVEKIKNLLVKVNTKCMTVFLASKILTNSSRKLTWCVNQFFRGIEVIENTFLDKYLGFVKKNETNLLIGLKENENKVAFDIYSEINKFMMTKYRAIHYKGILLIFNFVGIENFTGRIVVPLTVGFFLLKGKHGTEACAIAL